MDFDQRRKVSLHPFSPWRATPEMLERTLVAREHIIYDILKKSIRFYEGAPSKHCMIIGGRGLGKTHVLTLIYHYFDKNINIPYRDLADLSNNIIPVFLLEEERYSLNSLVRFLMKIFEKLDEKYSNVSAWKIPDYLHSDEDVNEYCFETLKKVSSSDNKKIIILCDNLEEIFKQWRINEYKTLRAFLSDQQAIMLIGTASKIFNEIINPNQPFYEFFETISLVDLNDSQMLELLKKRFIEDDLEEEFNRKQQSLKNKIAAIGKLTGGNPRLIVFLYDIVTKKNVLEIEFAIEEMMEELSEYFRNRFSELAPQEKTVLDAFGEMGGPATPKEISQKTRIVEKSTHAHIKKLKDLGYIEPVEFGKHKITRYDVTERLFRIWRQTASISGKEKYQILTRFLKLYYIHEDLRKDFTVNGGKIHELEISDKYLNTISDELNPNYIQNSFLVRDRFEKTNLVSNEKLRKKTYNWEERVIILIEKALSGDFGDNMEGLAGKIIKEKQKNHEIMLLTQFIFQIMDKCLLKGDFQKANGLYLTLLKLKEWHKIDRVQESIALYLRRLIDIQNRDLFIKSVNLANEYITEKDLLELIKAFIYAGRYLQDGNKVILEEVFPEIREVIFDIIENFKNSN